MTTSIALVSLIGLIVAAVSALVWVVVAGRQRQVILTRVDGRSGATSAAQVSILAGSEAGWSERVGAWLRDRLPASLVGKQEVADKLVMAGYDGSAAPVLFAGLRLVTATMLPLLAFTLGPRTNPLQLMLFTGFAVAIGVLGPPGVLDRLVAMRQTRLRRSLPDALDLLVVCVEAGVSLDAAILRVSRDMETAHPELSHELLIVNRKVNAGVPRDRALPGLWQRTGLEELRGLASSMVQSEKWGTSIATVLRVYAETLRRKRKQMAEKRAAEAAVKMLFPLMLFLLPALFIVIIGPAIISVGDMFKGMGQ